MIKFSTLRHWREQALEDAMLTVWTDDERRRKDAEEGFKRGWDECVNILKFQGQIQVSLGD
jgi:hypothetical protein